MYFFNFSNDILLFLQPNVLEVISLIKDILSVLSNKFVVVSVLIVFKSILKFILSILF